MDSRKKLVAALKGKELDRPVCACYDAFVKNDQVDWSSLLKKGLLILDHIEIINTNYPNINIRENVMVEGHQERRDVYWETDYGTLKETYMRDLNSYLLPWKTEELIKDDADYRIMIKAIEGAKHTICSPKHLFLDSIEEDLQPQSFYQIVSMDRTPLQKVQIDFTGLEKFAIDLAFQKTELLDLVEMMNEHLYDKFELIKDCEYVDIKLWENLTIDFLGPHVYRDYLIPVYQRLNKILKDSEKRLHVHYDGKMSLIKDDIAKLKFSGIDSFSAGPEGDVSIDDAVSAWKDTFLWINPSSTWYTADMKLLEENIKAVSENIETNRYCFVISEDLPPQPQGSIAAILDTLNAL